MPPLNNNSKNDDNVEYEEFHEDNDQKSIPLLEEEDEGGISFSLCDPVLTEFIVSSKRSSSSCNGFQLLQDCDTSCKRFPVNHSFGYAYHDITKRLYIAGGWSDGQKQNTLCELGLSSPSIGSKTTMNDEHHWNQLSTLSSLTTTTRTTTREKQKQQQHYWPDPPPIFHQSVHYPLLVPPSTTTATTSCYARDHPYCYDDSVHQSIYPHPSVGRNNGSSSSSTSGGMIGCSCVILNEKLYIVGGYWNGIRLNTMSSLDLRSKGNGKQLLQLKQEPPMKTVRNFSSAVAIPSQHVILVSGGRDSNGHDLDTVEEYNVITKRWRIIPEARLKQARYSHVMLYSEKYNCVIVMGGRGSSKPLSTTETLFLDSYYPRWDNNSMNNCHGWHYGPCMNEEREGLAATMLGDEYIIVAGGYSTYPCQKRLQSLEAISISDIVVQSCGGTKMAATRQWQLLNGFEMKKKRSYFGMICLNQTLLVFGRNKVCEYLNVSYLMKLIKQQQKNNSNNKILWTTNCTVPSWTISTIPTIQQQQQERKTNEPPCCLKKKKKTRRRCRCHDYALDCCCCCNQWLFPLSLIRRRKMLLRKTEGASSDASSTLSQSSSL